jgi:hypothetical protein
MPHAWAIARWGSGRRTSVVRVHAGVASIAGRPPSRESFRQRESPGSFSYRAVFTITGIRVQHPESAFRMPGIGVQLPPESAFSFDRNPCSAWAGARSGASKILRRWSASRLAPFGRRVDVTCLARGIAPRTTVGLVATAPKTGRIEFSVGTGQLLVSLDSAPSPGSQEHQPSGSRLPIDNGHHSSALQT